MEIPILVIGKKKFSAVDYPTFEEYLYAVLSWLEKNKIQSVEIKYHK